MRTHFFIIVLALIVSACASHDKVSDAEYGQAQTQAEQYSLNEGFASQNR